MAHQTGEQSDPHWFESVADHLGAAYLRYSFTKGTEQEVDALVALLGLANGARILDVGCGPGRHSLALAQRGFDVVGVDISAEFVNLATDSAASLGLRQVRFDRMDARTLSQQEELLGSFDAVISLCQGAFGLSGGPAGTGAEDQALAERELDESILRGIADVLRPGGRAAVSAFSAYFQLRFLEEGDSFDAAAGVNHEHTEILDAEGTSIPAELWTTCFTPRELRLLARVAGLEADAIHSVTPGAYRPDPPSVNSPEFLLLATKPVG